MVSRTDGFMEFEAKLITKSDVGAHLLIYTLAKSINIRFSDDYLGQLPTATSGKIVTIRILASKAKALGLV